jgi:hypothetical protein
MKQIFAKKLIDNIFRIFFVGKRRKNFRENYFEIVFSQKFDLF